MTERLDEREWRQGHQLLLGIIGPDKSSNVAELLDATHEHKSANDEREVRLVPLACNHGVDSA